MPAERDLIAEAMEFQNILIARATNGPEYDTRYQELRTKFINRRDTSTLIPSWVKSCRDLSQFWTFIQPQFPKYELPRAFIRSELASLHDHKESKFDAPFDEEALDRLTNFDATHVTFVWQKALDRRASDPEGAITSARTLLESVCKHILDDRKVEYDDKVKLPALYKLVATQLRLAPSQHTEEAFKMILGGCASVIEGLGSLRNKLSDSHGRNSETKKYKPSERHSTLAVNLAGTMAVFLIETWSVNKGEAE